jgi:fructokinase
MQIQPPTIVGLGEILWDIFPDGPRFGGAPANFVCHVANLCGRAWLVSAVGNDDLGDAAIAALEQHQVATDCIARSPHPTGTVQVQIDDAGQPSYHFGTDEAWDHLHWSQLLEDLAKRTSAVCFGTLGQRSEASRQLIRRFIKAVSPDALRILDLNLRPPFVSNDVIQESLQLANILKLNDDELRVLSSFYKLTGSQIEQLQALADQLQLRLIALTRGQSGAILIQGDRVSIADGVKVAVKDTVGAGDAYTATLTAGLLAGRDLDTINRAACEIATFVCSQSGATPKLPKDLCAKILR